MIFYVLSVVRWTSELTVWVSEFSTFYSLGVNGLSPEMNLGLIELMACRKHPFVVFCLVLYHQLSQKLGCSVTPKCKAWFGDLSKHNSKLGQHNSAYTKIKFLNKKSHLKKNTWQAAMSFSAWEKLQTFLCHEKAHRQDGNHWNIHWTYGTSWWRRCGWIDYFCVGVFGILGCPRKLGSKVSKWDITPIISSHL